MPEIQSAGGAVWGAGTTVQGAGGAVWGAGATVQSIGSTYTPPAAPPGATTIPDGSLAPLTEILPAAAYRSAHTPVLRNIRVVGDPLKFFNAPLKTDARDIMPSPATATLSGVPTFDGDGMTCPPGVRVFFEPHVLENQKLFADGYTVGIEYRVRVRNATVVPPGFNTNAVYIFSIYGFGQQVGFLMSGSTLYAHDYAGNIRAFEAPLGALPLDCVLSVAYPAGSGTAQLKINGVVVFTSTINSRIQSGIALGLQSVTGVNALKYSELRLERATVVTNGVSFTDGTILLATEGSVSLPDNATMWRLSATIPRADYETCAPARSPHTCRCCWAARHGRSWSTKWMPPVRSPAPM